MHRFNVISTNYSPSVCGRPYVAEKSLRLSSVITSRNGKLSSAKSLVEEWKVGDHYIVGKLGRERHLMDHS